MRNWSLVGGEDGEGRSYTSTGWCD